MSVDSKEESDCIELEEDLCSTNRKILFNVEDQESIYSSNVVGERGGTIEPVACDKCKITKSNTLSDFKNTMVKRIDSFKEVYNNPVK